MIAERKTHEPSSGLMRQVFLPIQPSRLLGVDTLLDGTGVHVCAASRPGRPCRAAIRSDEAASALDHRMIIVAPGVAGDGRLRRYRCSSVDYGRSVL